MKLVTKQYLKFATGIFWQIPDEGKSRINLGRIIKDTKHNMFCHIKSIHPTWGFCHKSDLLGQKKVASLGKFIVESSKLSLSYKNSIICFKFKSTGEIGDAGKKLEHDLYGYIVLLNSTICPEDGEYVATIEMVRQSIYEKASKYDIETLYLPVEVSSMFFSIFEILDDAYNNEELLAKVMQNLSVVQLRELNDLITNHMHLDASSILKYKNLIDNHLNINVKTLRMLIKEPEFVNKLRLIREKDLKYLIPNTFILPYTSEEVYWQEDKFKKNFRKSLLKPITSKATKIYKAIILIFGLISSIYFYGSFSQTHIVATPQQLMPKPSAIAVAAPQLILACLVDNDRFFRDLGTWELSNLRCDSLASIFSFYSQTDTTLSEFAILTQSNKGISFANKVGVYTKKYNLHLSSIDLIQMSKEYIVANLQKSSTDYSFKLSLMENNDSMHKYITKFTINSTQSPVFLFNHHVFDGVKLREITMVFDKSTGFYNWTIQGEF